MRAADVAYISHQRLKKGSAEGCMDLAPEVVAEIVSPSDRWTEINTKLEEYFAAGVVVVWVVDPQRRQVHVYRSPTQVEKLSETQSLALEAVLPGLTVPVAELFGD